MSSALGQEVRTSAACQERIILQTPTAHFRDLLPVASMEEIGQASAYQCRENVLCCSKTFPSALQRRFLQSAPGPFACAHLDILDGVGAPQDDKEDGKGEKSGRSTPHGVSQLEM